MEKQNSFGRSLVNSKKSQSRGQRSRKHLGRDQCQRVENDSKFSTKLPVNSVIQESCLEEFLSKAELAGTEFVAEKMNIKIVNSNATVMPIARNEEIRKLQERNKSHLKLPRRPAWDSQMSTQELYQNESRSFLEWRKLLAELQEIEGLILTPFERNLELWRQLWRVLERSNLTVQIVDSRNPLLFRSEDLECCVKEIDTNNQNLLLLSKADLLTVDQRRAWAEHFQKAGIRTAFWSAVQEQNRSTPPDNCSSPGNEKAGYLCEEGPKTDLMKIYNSAELIELFRSLTAQLEGQVVVGMVGYPNVGKSSAINRILGQKKVPVSKTPGKTKHFQTLPIDERLILCDCPGLVMPSFAFSREEMVISGIIPVNQLSGNSNTAIALLCTRFPRHTWEHKYGIKLPSVPEHQERCSPTPHELLTSLAFARGFMTSKGVPDCSRAARLIISDVVSGKLCWAAAPPQMNQEEFNDFHFCLPDSRFSGGEVKLAELEKRNLIARKPTSAEEDSKFFLNSLHCASYSKGHPVTVGSTLPGSKKHHNRNKKEKLRRVFADRDT